MIGDHEARVALLIVELFVPGAQTLKDKRQVIRSVKERVRGRFNVSVAEVGALDKWQRAVLAFSSVSNDSRKLDSEARQILDLIERTGQLQVIESALEIL